MSQPPGSNTVGPMVSISSLTAHQLTSSTLDSLVEEINDKAAKMALWPWMAVLAVVSLLVAAGEWDNGLVASFLSGVASIAICMAAAWVYFWDTARRSTVLFYDLDPTSEQAFSFLADGVGKLAGCGGKWRIDATGRVLDTKYHAGASSLVQRKPLQLGVGTFSKVKCNLDVPYIVVGSNTLYFCPDRLFMVTGGRVAAIGYDELTLRVGSTQFVESDSVPSDATIIGHTWQYVNKSGGPDRRFKNNRQLPVVRYDELFLTSVSGLVEVLQFSRTGVANLFCQAAHPLISQRRNRCP
ncbi:hypothetical protein PQR75_05235 [Paraburkholderia fungorum]|uniref:hypothetical protein n=1 Tax=Paraburkholderia fungorum TaxID=134537 RepID=UPI0038BBE5E3